MEKLDLSLYYAYLYSAIYPLACSGGLQLFTLQIIDTLVHRFAFYRCFKIIIRQGKHETKRRGGWGGALHRIMI